MNPTIVIPYAEKALESLTSCKVSGAIVRVKKAKSIS